MDDPTYLKAEDFSVVSLQASAWTPEYEVSAKHVMAKLYPSWSELFNAEPMAYPAPQGLPRTVPRVVLDEANGNWRCEIASERINVAWRRHLEKSEPLDKAAFLSRVIELLIEYRRFSGARIGRLALVVSSYVRHESPARFLATQFCRPELLEAPLNRPESFELHAHKRFSLAGRWTVNSWVRNKTARVAVGKDQQPAVVVDQDLNTLAEEVDSRDFSEDETREFFEAAASESPKILALYYPGN